MTFLELRLKKLEPFYGQVEIIIPLTYYLGNFTPNILIIKILVYNFIDKLLK